MIPEELTYEEHSNDLTQIFKTQPLILLKFIGNIVVSEYIEDFI